MNRAANMRATHQPSPEPSPRPNPSEADLLSTCSRTAALILAIDEGTTPLNVEFEDPLRDAVVCGEEAIGNEPSSGEHNVQAGDLIVTTMSEHHSNMLPWLMLAQRKGARLAFVPVGVDSYYLRRGAIQYEVGTPPISQAVGWAAAVDYLEWLGMDEVAFHSASLTTYLLSGIHGIEGAAVWGDHSRPDGQTGLVSFSLAGIAPLDLGTACGKLGVAIRSGGHCVLPLAASIGVAGTGRASFGAHTTREDVEALVVAVETCRHLYRR